MSKMTYKKAIQYLSGLNDYEKSPQPLTVKSNYDLRRMQELLNKLGNPHSGRKTVHIAGTKGKGSTACMIASILATAGYTTGLFTSPHLFSWQERIALNGKNITQKEFTALVEAIKPCVDDLNFKAKFGHLTTFEVLTAMALAYFNLKKAAIQVLEVGLGGRLDSTNVVHGDICVITSLSLDHTAILGDSLEKIAREKAGIIKRGSIVISAPQPPEAAAVIRTKCRSLNTPLLEVANNLSWHRTGGDYSHQSFTLRTQQQTYDLSIPLLGDHQMENAACAVAAIEALQSMRLKITHHDIVKGMARVNWPLRLQVLGSGPLLVIDGAHNVYSVKTLVSAIRKYFKFRRAFVIFGASRDKDIAGMARELKVLADEFILTSSKHARAASPEILKGIFRQAGITAFIADTGRDALSRALTCASSEDIIVATGSLFLAADIGTEAFKLKEFN